MAPSDGVKVLTTKRVWILVNSILTIFCIFSVFSIENMHRREITTSLKIQLEVLLESKIHELEMGNYRKFVEAIGKFQENSHISVIIGDIKIENGTKGVSPICTNRRLTFDPQISVEFCRNRVYPLIWWGAIFLLFILLSIGNLFLTRKLENLAVGSLSRFLTERGIEIQQNKLSNILDTIEKTKIELDLANKRERELIKFEAIARTTQMLAHDVRKPFSIIRSGIQVFEASKSYGEMKAIIPQLRQAIDQSLTSVNSMIEDIMEVGKETRVEVLAFGPQKCIRQALEEIGQIHGDRSIKLSFEWHHRHKVLGDPQKIKRVFSNILANACQAMRSGGEIWIQTQEHGREITFTLGNSGSSIAKEDCDKLFEAFFTKGKKGGTGLGLAIAKKIVEAHGGKIWVESDTQKQTVEFFITLACAEAPDDAKDLSFPSQLSEYRMLRVPQAEPPTRPKAKFVETIQGHVQKHGQKLQIAILDDESLYRKAVVKLAASEPLTELFEFHEFCCPRDFLDADLSAFDFLISDVDLQDQDLNGYDVVSRIRDELDLSLPICIHSNKTLAQDFKKAVEVGASAVLPKPLTLDHLLKFIVDGLADLSDQKTVVSQVNPTEKPKVAFIDDDSFLRKIVPTTMADADVQTFACPEEFLKSCSPKDIAKFQAIITDQYFDQESDTLGLQLAELLRDFHCYPGLLILFSDGSFAPKDRHG